MKWTNEQRLAIELDGDLIVSAAAGAGKTAVLTERIASRIQAGVGVEQLLVLTFTRAAASEMKTRITQRLNALAESCEAGAEKSRLMQQARAVDGAYISTVHAFCARVLRRHYHTIGLAASWRIADEMETAALIERVRDAFLTALSQENDEGYRALLYAFGGEEQAWEAMMKTYRFTMAQPDPVGWLTRAAARYGGEENLQRFLNDALTDCKAETALIIHALEEAQTLLSPDYAGVLSVLDDDLSQYRALLLCEDYRGYRASIGAVSYRVMRFPKDADAQCKREVQRARQQGKDLVSKQKELFVRTDEEALDTLRRAGAVVEALCAFVEQFMAAYAEAKREKGVLDYDDLEHFTLQVLQNERVSREYRERFAYIAVDEYQDSNRVQEEIVSRVSRGRNRFFVGDVKQSIYRFRQAEPKLFLDKLVSFGERENGRVDLKSNFRSAHAIIDTVNALFVRIMSMESCGMAYDARARLVASDSALTGKTELHVIEKSLSSADDETEDAVDAALEARLIAGRIHALMQEEAYFDPKTNERRAYRYADFAILLRASTNAQVYAQTLAKCGVPCYALASGGYFDAVEVKAMLDLLRAIDNRRQDVPLLSAASSPLGDFTFDELASIRANHREGAFHEALFACAAGDEPLSARAAAFLARLDHYRAESRLLSVEALIGLLLDETGYYEEVGAGAGGAQRQANLNALLDKARVFEQSGMRGVWNFLRHIELASKSAQVSAAQTVSADVVRIMTIHKSKGLEFPVVFAADLGRRFDTREVGNALQLHAEYGVGLRFLDGAGASRVKRDTLARQVLAKRIRFEERAEEMRVLYVALTRARERLILTGCLSEAEEKLDAPPLKYNAWDARSASAPLGWIVGARPPQLQVWIHAREQYLAAGESLRQTTELPRADEKTKLALEAALSWRYPHASASKLPAKASVSALEQDEAKRVTLKTPVFLEGVRDATFVGTATHAVLQGLPAGQRMDETQAAAYIESLRVSGAITGDQAAASDAGAVAWFTQTPLYERFSKSERVERELPFSYAADACVLFETDADERVILQGVIDACFLEDGGWVLLDYKTDRVRNDVRAADAAKKHRTQLKLYAMALEQLTHIRVNETIVVLLDYRSCVSL